MDLAVTALVAVTTGAVGAALVSAFFASKADKRRVKEASASWLRERRYEVYREFLVEADFLNLGLKREDDGLFTREAMTKAATAVSAVALVGPQSVYVAAVDYQNVAKAELERIAENEATNWDALILARSHVGMLMQEQIGVPVRQRVRPIAAPGS